MLSIVIPTLNEEKQLPLLLDSIKKQDFKDYEIIVSDAGSKDKTTEIAKNAGCKVVKGGVITVGRNKGAEAASGEIVIFIDADAILPHEKFLSNSLKDFSQRKLGIAGFPLAPVGGKIIDKLALSVWNTIAILTQGFLPHAAAVMMVKKEVHQAFGGFDEEIIFVEDHSYVREGRKIAKFGIINEPVLVSVRRYEKDGRLQTYTRYTLAGLHLIFIGPIKSDIFKYKFGHYDQDQK